MTRRQKITTAAVAGAVVVAAVLVRVMASGRPGQSSGGPSRSGAGPQGPVSVITAPVTWQNLRDRREFTGAIKPSFSYVISAKVPGRLLTLTKRIGDRVKRDESVGRIDDTEYRQAEEEALAQVRVSQASKAEAEALLAQSSREVERGRELLAKGILSQAEFDALQTQLASYQARVDLASAQLAQRQAALAQARTRLEYTALRAAQPGLVAVRHVDGGQLLATGAAVLTVIGIDTVFLEIPLTERDYGRVRQGSEAQVTVEALAGRTFSGTVCRVAPQFDAASRTATAEIAIVNDSLLLRPGMFARISITLGRVDSAQVVPETALTSREGAPVVFTVRGDTARMVPVTVGISDGGMVQIVQPVLSEPVVTLGHHLLKDGGRVMRAAPGGGRGDTAARPGPG